MPVGHALDVHHFLMISAVVVHDAHQRNAVVSGGPEGARRIHQIAIGLDRNGKSAVLAVRQRPANGAGRAVADPGCAAAARRPINGVDVPEPRSIAADQRPILLRSLHTNSADRRAGLIGDASHA